MDEAQVATQGVQGPKNSKDRCPPGRIRTGAASGGQAVQDQRTEFSMATSGVLMRPTKAAIDAIREAYMADVLTIRAHILALNDPHLEDAWAGIETFAAVALRVMAKTNPSKLKSEMVTVGISALL
jgi:hypothetical protein